MTSVSSEVLRVPELLVRPVSLKYDFLRGGRVSNLGKTSIATLLSVLFVVPLSLRCWDDCGLDLLKQSANTRTVLEYPRSSNCAVSVCCACCKSLSLRSLVSS